LFLSLGFLAYFSAISTSHTVLHIEITTVTILTSYVKKVSAKKNNKICVHKDCNSCCNTAARSDQAVDLIDSASMDDHTALLNTSQVETTTPHSTQFTAVYSFQTASSSSDSSA